MGRWSKKAGPRGPGFYGTFCKVILITGSSMSNFNDIDITCEQCGQEFRGTVWTAVHAGQDPELKVLLLGGELNLVMCPQCGYVAYHDRFILYQDPAAEIVAYVYPQAQEPN